MLNREHKSELFMCHQGTKNKKNVIRDNYPEISFEIEGRDRNKWSQMHMDDLTIGEVHDMASSKRHITEKKEQRTIHAKHCERVFEDINE